MKREACMYEQTLTKGVASNQLNESQRAHLAACDLCREAVRVASWMRRLAEATDDARRALPSADFIRWKKQLLEKQEIARRATRPITIIQALSSMIAALTIIVLLLWQPSAIEHGLGVLLRPPTWNLFSSLGAFSVLLAIASLSLPLLCLAVVFVLNRTVENKSRRAKILPKNLRPAFPLEISDRRAPDKAARTNSHHF